MDAVSSADRLAVRTRRETKNVALAVTATRQAPTLAPCCAEGLCPQ